MERLTVTDEDGDTLNFQTFSDDTNCVWAWVDSNGEIATAFVDRNAAIRVVD